MKKETIPPEELKKAMAESWSVKSSSKWSRENPAKGQCGVTALVVNDLLGGEIKKTKLTEGWHFYNFISGKRYDFTASQFSENITYADVPSNREEAFSDTNAEQYCCLRQKVWTVLRL
ncbi:hypothetical protein I7V34_21800 [Bacillus sp. V3]|nr:hypothetical protein I7V34_21800 [Bacillus sp. V3]